MGKSINIWNNLLDSSLFLWDPAQWVCAKFFPLGILSRGSCADVAWVFIQRISVSELSSAGTAALENLKYCDPLQLRLKYPQLPNAHIEKVKVNWLMGRTDDP